MTRARLLDLVSFTGYFVVAALLGRMCVLPGTHLAVVWPAAGVAAAWLAVNGWSRWVLLDVVVLFAAAAGVNAATGAAAPLSVGLGVATVLQTLVFGILVSRWCPTWWGFGDEPPPGVETVRELGHLVAAAALSAFAAALLGPAAVISVVDTGWSSVLSWVLRNGGAVVAIFPLSLLARHLVRSASPDRGPTPVGPLRGRGPVELAALALVTGTATWLVFVVDQTVPVPFLLLVTSAWVGTRFSPGIADVHAILLSGAVVAATVADAGPFASIADESARALVVEAYVAVAVALTLTLSVVRRESLLVNDRLLRSEKAATAQATLIRTIVDSMADGVSVVDADGRVVLRNPAAELLVGAPRQDDAGVVDVAAYGLRHADGRPLAPDESPMALAMSGATVEKEDLFLRNPAAPDGRLLEVTARPLPDSDPPMVVVLFHDVTADRRERDELASFAGVVAHDLLNPLTVVEGWSEALLEEARVGLPSDPGTRAERLERIQRAAQRMQHLISDLLAYTTARDLAIKPVRVDLGEVVRDVARARVDASRVRETAEPRIEVAGELPDVLAEPVLLRQVVDNLIGNAVKYVGPGVTPEIRVSARQAATVDGPMVVLEISDNGIGIPDGQHAQVFDSFHRAHKDGYRGTGLGLAIVKRVVERHGGTAAARDNDGRGGTTMTVSFPAARLADGPVDPPVQEQ